VKATPGRIVHYRLSDADAALINQNRADGGTIGNAAHDGDYYPAMVVRNFGHDPYVNLQVFLDGPDSYWATSRREGDEPGTWTWPPKVEATTTEADTKPETMGNTHPGAPADVTPAQSAAMGNTHNVAGYYVPATDATEDAPKTYQPEHASER